MDRHERDASPLQVTLLCQLPAQSLWSGKLCARDSALSHVISQAAWLVLCIWLAAT